MNFSEASLEQHLTNLNKLPNYSTMYNQCKDTHGVCLFTKNSFDSNIIEELSFTELHWECMSVELQNDSCKDFVGSFYRPPRGKSLSFRIIYLTIRENVFLSNYSDMITLFVIGILTCWNRDNLSTADFIPLMYPCLIFPMITKSTLNLNI